MSISALLMDEPGPAKPPQSSPTRLSPPVKRKAVPEKLQRPVQEAASVAMSPQKSAAHGAAYQHDDDVTDSETESTSMALNGHKPRYQYHNSANADYDVDMERTDSDISNISLEEERMKWMRNVRKRQMELEEIEMQRRKVFLDLKIQRCTC